MKYLKLLEDHSIYTNDRFWGTIASGILPIAKSTGRILIPFRSKYVNEPNTWGTFGGKLDDMKTNDPKKAAKIELEEEAGYGGNIKLINAYIYKKKDQEGNNIFTYYNYIGIIDDEFEPILNWETESYKWVTFEELLSIEPKHFGLKGLIENSKDLIKRYSK